MKTAVIYQSRYGCTADCAALLAAKLPQGAVLFDLQKEKNISLEEFDTVLLGGPVYVGVLPKGLRRFCKERLGELCGKRVGLFVCCAMPSEAESYFAAGFPEELRKHARGEKALGGQARMERMGIVHCMVVKAATKGQHEKLELSEKAMEQLVQAVG